MKRSALLPLLLMCWCQGYTQTGSIAVHIVTPNSSPIQVVGDNLNIQVTVTSTYQINSVTASVPGAGSVPLTYSGPSTGYTGTISLLGLPQDTTALTVTAIDAYNNTANTTATFIYDHPPTLTIDSPGAYTVATPNLRVRTRCHSDSGACTITLVLSPTNGTNISLGTYTGSVDTSYDLSVYEGQNGYATNSMYLEVTAVDNKRGIAANTLPWVPVYVETSPYLVPVFSADYQINDLSGNKVFVTRGPTLLQPHIIDITNGSVTNIPFTGGIDYTHAHLTSTGAVFEGTSSGFTGGWSNFFEWYNGSLDSLGRQADPASNVFAGDYGTCTPYPTTTSVTFRNFATQMSQVIPNISGGSGGISPSGVLSYAAKGSKYGEILWNLYSFANGSATVVADDSSGIATGAGAVTDGTHILYARTNANTYTGYVLFGSGGNYLDTLATFPPRGQFTTVPITSGQGYYLINNGYSAYLNANSQNLFQVWIRDTTGKKTQITFTGSEGDNRVEYLSPKGELSYFMPALTIGPGSPRPSARTIYTPTGGSVRIGGVQGQAYYTDSTWYVVIGRTVFKLNLAITPNKSDNFTLNVKPGTSYSFSSSGFDTHFEGSGYPTKVVFTKLPAHGTLTVKGVLVTANVVIPRASLQNLVYTPTTGYTGVDTVKWFGATDYTTSIDTALLLLNVNVASTPPVQPLITGLNPTYCGNGGTASFTMTNFPDTTSGATVVTDSVDNKPLTIGVGASCSIILSGLSAGVHTVKVTYTNAGGSSSLLAAVTVIAPSTPTVSVSASYTTIPDTAASVVVRAKATSGGGSLPQYTYALNRNFSPALYGPGTADSVIIDTSALVAGANTVYVRMQTSDTCYILQSGTDSIVITLMPPTLPPAAPQITGVLADYCQNLGAQQVTVSNMPGSGSGITVSGNLDGQAVTVSAAGVITIQPQALTVGAHTLSVIFTNPSGADTTKAAFQVEKAVTPVVKLAANPANLTAATTHIELEASDVSGGGSQPLFTFSRDAGFTSIIQAQGPADSASVAVSGLVTGKNVFYVRMQTSDSCVTAATATDSVVVVKTVDTVPQPPSGLTAGPNPFKGTITINGLKANLSYGIGLFNSMGQEVIGKVVQGQTQVVLQTGTLQRGIYFLKLYDLSTGRVVAIVRLLSANH